MNKIIEKLKEAAAAKRAYLNNLWRDDPWPKVNPHTCAERAKQILNSYYGAVSMNQKTEKTPALTIKNVIFNAPATIVFWSDDTKTVVQCGEGDIYDPEKGLAMAISKKFLGTNKSGSNYCNIFKQWLKKVPKKEELAENAIHEIAKRCEIPEKVLISSDESSIDIQAECERDFSCRRCKHYESSLLTSIFDGDGREPCVSCVCGGEHANFEPAGGFEPERECTDCVHEDREHHEVPCLTCWYKSEHPNFDPKPTQYNPVEKAYELMVGFRNGKTTDIDAVIGFLGEALE